MLQHFESDDPDLYTTKIQYILENDVTDLDLKFVEEEFVSGSGPPRVSTVQCSANKVQSVMTVKGHQQSGSCPYSC